jgi:acetyl-CoA carboxylase biotin carboxyl carrier protein
MAERSGDEKGLLTDDIRELLRLLAQSDIQEISIERGDARLHVKRGGVVAQVVAQAPNAPLVAPQAAAAPAVGAAAGGVELPAGYTVTSPMVGTFYSAPSPKDPPFVQEGAEVHVGDVVGIVEAMKMMNEIDCEVSGRVARILVKNGQPVEYGQPLMVIEPI